MATPAILNYLLTYRCSYRCVYCYANVDSFPTPVEMSLKRVKELIEEARALGVINMFLTGGDPLLHPHVEKILSLIIEAGIIPFVSTKQLLLDVQIGKLRDAGLERIQVSIDTLDAQIAKFLLGVKDYPGKMIKTINKLISKGLKVATNSVVTPYNIKGIPTLVGTLCSLGVYYISVTPYSRSLYRHRDDLLLQMEDYKWLNEQISLLQERYPQVKIKFQDSSELCNPTKLSPRKREEMWNKRSICTVGREGLTIWPDGKIGICEEMPYLPQYWMGDLMVSSLENVWDSPRMEELLIPPRDNFKGWPCYECEDFEECHRGLGRCLRDALKIYGTIYAPPSPVSKGALD
ncbi:MAG: radical SAM protein [bacterium]